MRISIYHIKSMLQSKTLWLVISVIFSVLLAFISLLETDALPQLSFDISDKLVHVILYLIYTCFIGLSFSKVDKDSIIIILVIPIIFGISIELCQKYFTKTRMFDTFDILSNVIGTFAGLFLLLKYQYKR